MKVKALEMTVGSFARTLNRQCVKNKEIALEMGFEHGIRGNITPRALKKAGLLSKGGHDIFDAKGNLTDEAKQGIARELESLGLPQNATIEQFMEAVKDTQKTRLDNFMKVIKEFKLYFFDKKITPKHEIPSHTLEKLDISVLKKNIEKVKFALDTINLKNLDCDQLDMMRPKHKIDLSEILHDKPLSTGGIDTHFNRFKQ